MNFTLYYRNFLKYCNYKCVYCPFSKYELDEKKLEKDKQFFNKFINFLENSSDTYRLFFTPKGEILNFDYYKSGITKLSMMNNIDEIVIQTNLSGNLDWIKTVNKDKLVLWTTYHPNEVSLHTFFSNLEILDNLKIKFSVGIVGTKENFDACKLISEKVLELVKTNPYLWINAYKDEKNYYSNQEIKFLSSIDPLFEINLKNYPSKGEICKTGESVFWVEYNGLIHRCWQDKKVLGNIYKNNLMDLKGNSTCNYSLCTCYIGYINMKNMSGLEKMYKKSLLGRIK